MPKQPPPDQLELDLVRYKGEDGPHDFLLDLHDQTLWATRPEIAALFRASETAVERQVAAVYAEGELGREDTVQPMQDGTERYNLDLILSVGYRLNAARATAFRRWASRALRGLMLDGFVMDAARLRDNRAAAEDLAGRLRAIRADEANIYETVRASFALGADDYEAESDAGRRFVQRLEDTFIHAVTGETAPQLVLERADHEKPAMGLRGEAALTPSMDEARIAQNYLDADELYRLHLLCEQFLLALQQRAMRGRRMSMAELGHMLDDLLRLNDYPVLPRHKSFHAERAVRHAQAEYARYVMRTKAGSGPQRPRPAEPVPGRA